MKPLLSASLVAGMCMITVVLAQNAPPAGPSARVPEAFVPTAAQGWQSMFDGKSLGGWDGNPDVWSVKDGLITAETTDARRVAQTQLIWKGGEPSDFEWFMEVKLDARIHSGISYRSALDLTKTPTPEGGRGGPLPFSVPSSPKWTLYGLNFDFDYDGGATGNLQELGSTRRTVARRGEFVVASAGERPRVIATFAESAALRSAIKMDDWNQVHIIARGRQITHILNGRVMAVFVDDDPVFFKPKGLLGLQLENYETGRLNVRNLWIKLLDATAAR